MRDFIRTNSFNAVAAGQTATLDLPVGGLTYHQLRLYYATATAGGATEANMEAEITAIRLKVDGKVQRRIKPAELFDLNRFNGFGVNAGELPIFFGEPNRRTVQGEDALAWGTADISNFQVEVDIAGGAGVTSLSARAEVERIARPMGPIVKWRRHTIPITATGINNVTTLPKSDAYYRLHAWSGNIDAVEVRVDQETRFEADPTQMGNLLADYGLTAQAGVFHVVFDRTLRVGDALAMRGAQRAVSEFRVDFDMGAAASFDLLAEVIGPRD